MSAQYPLYVYIDPQRRRLGKILNLILVLGAVWLATSAALDNGTTWMGIALLGVCILPAWLWCRGVGQGLPVFPVFALIHCLSFALPLVTQHPDTQLYPPEIISGSAFSAALFLLSGTLAWYLSTKKPLGAHAQMLVLDTNSQNLLVWFPLIAAIGHYFVGVTFGWGFLGGLQSVLTAAILGFQTLAVFTLSFKIGAGEVPPAQRRAFAFLLATLMILNASSFLLIGAISLFLVSIIGFVTASGRIPWRVILPVLLAVMVLHVGKHDMREKYWGRYAAPMPEWYEMPMLYAEWIGYAVDPDNLLGIFAAGEDSEDEPVWWRTSLVHLLFLAQDKHAQGVPLLEGETYALVPVLLVPRVFYPDKPWTHEGTYRLNIHFGRQTYEQTRSATIGWGLLNEAWANFGNLGMIIVGAGFGVFFGMVAAGSAAAPILSLRSLFAILVLSYTFRENTMGVLASSLFQSTVALLGLAFLIMRKQWVPQVRQRLRSATR